ncbi:MAG: DUF4402 domain-containing protein [Alphaproteobacteria bacterium]
MKNYRKYIGAVALTLSVAGFIAYNAQAATAVDGNASATIDATLSVLETTAMAFGTIAADGSASTVVIDTSDTISAPNCGGGNYLCTGVANSGLFTIAGGDTSVVNVAVSGSPVLGDGTNTMALALGALDSPTVTLVAGAGTFKVGGTLTVGATQAAGAYTTGAVNGTVYTATVSY